MTQPRVVGARYELGELIGYGGMAEVHRGHDTRLNREVAIKVLRADLARDPSFLARFRREAHSAAGLNHPSIVSVYDTGEDLQPDGTPQPFIVMEFVEGRTLRDILKSEGSLPARRAMEITADICAALDFSHRNGIVHRDIKPANVMITPQGAVKVMDFGIARAVADTSATVTQTANVIGTAQYLSPEQARGETVDARSDVYSTGCLLYELVTGVPPFQGDSPVAVAYQHVRENPVMPSARRPELPRAIDSIVMKALAKNQLNRYQSAGDMRSDIQRALADQPVTAEAVMTDAERTQFIARTPPPAVPPRPVVGYGEPEPEEERRHRGWIWAAVVVALLVVIGVAAFLIVDLGGGDSGGTAMVSVPSIVGQDESTAKATLAQAGLRASRGDDTSGKCTGGQQGISGHVCVVSPAPDQMVTKDSVVTYQLYKTPTLQVPAVEGMQVNAAVSAIVKAGIKYDNIVQRQVNNAEDEGTVLKQDPGPYDPISTTGKVTLLVSTGKLVLPDVKGKTFDEARAAINHAGFNEVHQDSDTEETDDESLDGKVADEDPTGDGKLTYAPDQPVTLKLYEYVAPQTQPTCDPNATSTTTPPNGPTMPPTPGQSSSSSSSTTTLPPCTTSSSPTNGPSR